MAFWVGQPAKLRASSWREESVGGTKTDRPSRARAAPPRGLSGPGRASLHSMEGSKREPVMAGICYATTTGREGCHSVYVATPAAVVLARISSACRFDPDRKLDLYELGSISFRASSNLDSCPIWLSLSAGCSTHERDRQDLVVLSPRIPLKQALDSAKARVSRGFIPLTRRGSDDRVNSFKDPDLLMRPVRSDE